MELSKCRICGERHKLGGCPESAALAAALAGAFERERRDNAGQRQAELARGEAVTQRTVNAPIAGSNPAEPAKKSFDRNAYQREYMRGYRLRKKAEK